MSGVSVVIPTKGRVGLVRHGVQTLLDDGSGLPDDVGWEVLIVDDSDEADAAQLRALADGDRVRYLPGPARVGAKRNVGARAARWDRLVFLDSDCCVTEGFLAAHLAAADIAAPSGRPVGAVAGPVSMADDAVSWRTRLADYSPLFNAPFEWPGRYAELYWACTANLSVERKVFDVVGGFDEETYTVVGGEDVDFCLRLQDAGYAVCSQPDAVAVHTRTLLSSFGDLASKMLLYGRTSVYNTVRHPHHRGFHPNPAGLVPLAIASLPLPRARRAVAVAAAAWFAGQSLSLMARTRQISPLAVPAVALEWAFDAGIAAEAVRRRRITEISWRFRYFDSRLYRPFDRADADLRDAR